MMEDIAWCRHCGRRIVRGDFAVWEHANDHATQCRSDVNLYATPKESA